jgi:hypothetical protein
VCGLSCSYLARRDELQWSQRTLHVGDVGLEVVERIGDAGLDLRRRLPRRAVGGDLVEGGRRHDGGLWSGGRSRSVVMEDLVGEYLDGCLARKCEDRALCLVA